MALVIVPILIFLFLISSFIFNLNVQLMWNAGRVLLWKSKSETGLLIRDDWLQKKKNPEKTLDQETPADPELLGQLITVKTFRRDAGTDFVSGRMFL